MHSKLELYSFRDILCLKWRNIFSVRVRDALDKWKPKVSIILPDIIWIQSVISLVLEIEVIGFAGGFDMAHFIKFDMQIIRNQIIPIFMMTDSSSLPYDFVRMSSTTEICLKIDLNQVECVWQDGDSAKDNFTFGRQQKWLDDQEGSTVATIQGFPRLSVKSSKLATDF